MQTTINRDPRKKERKAITIPITNSFGVLSKKECKQLLRIYAEDTINDYFKALGLFGQDFVTWEDFRELLQMQCFLGLKAGYNTKAMFVSLRSQGMIDSLLENYGINVNTRLEKIRNDYNKR